MKKKVQVKKVVKQKFAEKLWLNNGVQNACKKKNVLYKEFLKKITKEHAYKTKIN